MMKIAKSYGVSLGGLALALLVRGVLTPVLGGQLPFITLFAAVAVAVWAGGPFPALVVTLLGYVAAGQMFMPDGRWARLDQPETLVGLLAYLLSCAVIIGFGVALGSSNRRCLEAERAAKERADTLRVTFASIGDAVVTTDRFGAVSFMNAVAERLTGWTLADSVGKPLEEVFVIVNEVTGATVENPVQKVLETGGIVGLANHTVLIDRHGGRRPIEDSAAPIRKEDGDTTGVVLVFHDVSEKRDAQVALAKSESELSDFFETAALGLHWVGPDGTILRANPADYESLGYTREEYVGSNIVGYHADRGVIDDILRRLHAGERIEHQPAQLVRKDGSLMNVLIDSSVRFESGQFVHTRCFTRNVDDQVFAQQALRKSEERLRLALEAGGMGTWEWIVGESAVEWSPSLEALHGLEPGQFEGTFEAYLSDVHPEDLELLKERVAETLQGGGEHFVEYRIIRPDGSIRWVEGRGKVFLDDQGNPQRVVGVCADITTRKETEVALEEQARAQEVLFRLAEGLQRSSSLDEVYDAALQAIMVALKCDRASILLYDEAGVMRFVAWRGLSEAYRLVTEGHSPWTPSDLDPGPLPVADIESADLDEGIRQTVRKEGIRSLTFIPLTLDGKLIGKFMAYFDKPHRFTEDETEISLTIARQLSAGVGRARALQILRDSDRRKDEFLATLAHELRGPLAPVQNSLELLKSAPARSKTAAIASETMGRQITHMVRLIDDLLDLSRISRDRLDLRKEHLELAPILRQSVEACQPVATAAGHHLELDIPSEPISLYADPVRLVQVFANLVNNACKYSEPGGTIQIMVTTQDDHVRVAVRDTGIGIAPEKITGIFEMFSQVDSALHRSQGGLGIGLTLTRRLVEMHEGTVTAHSAGLGQGSEFVVTLPITTTLAQNKGLEQATRSASVSQALRILVVDDNQDAAKSLGLLLETIGHDVQTANDGEHALRLAEEYRPDLVLLDIGLPKLNGYQVASELRGRPWGKHIVLVALTGWGQEEDRQRSAEAGFDRHIVKPIDFGMLRDLISELQSDETTV